MPNPMHGVPQASAQQGINPMSGMTGYGYDPLTPAVTPGMSQGTPSQHFSIATPPHPQQVG
eukprot:6487625-Amphidinium_carterae.1